MTRSILPPVSVNKPPHGGGFVAKKSTDAGLTPLPVSILVEENKGHPLQLVGLFII
jgi:hypothetical protein